MRWNGVVRRGWQAAVVAAAILSGTGAEAGKNAYLQRNLVSDGTIPAEHTDSNLVNAWGLAFNPNAVAWVADNGAGVATLYDGNGEAVPLVVTIPSADGVSQGTPTGVTFSGSDEFKVTRDSCSGPARFIFASEDGIISAWAPDVDFTHALVVADGSTHGAVYKGIALAGNGKDFRLFATDFRNAKIDVYDTHFQPVTLEHAFEDHEIPDGFAPFGIRNLNGNLYVTYAQQDEDKEDDVAGKGLGFVDVFDAKGALLRRLIKRGALNAPWGLAEAPAGFGKFSNRLLVGNFGDGFINAYDLATGRHLGRLKRPDGQPLAIDGLWGLSFGNGLLNQPSTTLFFAAGPQDEQHGLYGRIDVKREKGDEDCDEHDDGSDN